MKRARSVLFPRPLATALVLWCAAACCGQETPPPSPPAEGVVNVFDLWEARLPATPAARAVAALLDTQIHDAYDADRNGVYARVSATFTTRPADGRGRSVTVPAFAMRAEPGGPWEWRVRWSPRSEGVWEVRFHIDARAGRYATPVSESFVAPFRIRARATPNILGPLVAPAGDENPFYLRRLKPDGRSEALWLFGVCRAWVVPPHDDAAWGPHESIDRAAELFGPMRDAGYNLLNQWMAPWEYLLVHHDRAAHWRQPDGTWQRRDLPDGTAWTAFQCYDQGRARSFDDLVTQCEGDAAKQTLYLMLCPLSHHSLQMSAHPWGYNESGWSPKDDDAKQTPEKLNGFSAFREDMSAWQYFEADPARPLDDWRSRLFDHQANYWRYLVARWGYSRAVGIWVLMDEVDAVGDEIGSLPDRKGWWARPACRAWMANTARMLKGQLVRSDGLRYMGDPYAHPLHAAATAETNQGKRGGNVDWDGGPDGARVDVLGWHWYPYWPWASTWPDAWRYTIDGILSFANAPTGASPRLISEFGAYERYSPTDRPSRVYPTIYHHGIWAAVLSGLSGTVMDWDDGKEYGEMRWRTRKGAFYRTQYPIDNTQELKALRRFLGRLSPDALRPCRDRGTPVTVQHDPFVRVCALHSTSRPRAVYGWLFSTTPTPRFRVAGLSKGRYELTWYDPWTGRPVPRTAPVRLTVPDTGHVTLDARKPLAALAPRARAFPNTTRHHRGLDVAFKIIPLPSPSR